MVFLLVKKLNSTTIPTATRRLPVTFNYLLKNWWADQVETVSHDKFLQPVYVTIRDVTRLV